jgi:hypothetical protein
MSKANNKVVYNIGRSKKKEYLPDKGDIFFANTFNT